MFSCTHTTDSISFFFFYNTRNKNNTVRGDFPTDGFVCNMVIASVQFDRNQFLVGHTGNHVVVGLKNGKLNYYQATHYCQGRIASIHSKTENKEIEDQMAAVIFYHERRGKERNLFRHRTRTRHKLQHFATHLPVKNDSRQMRVLKIDYVWIGLRRNAGKLETWEDGTPVNYKNWAEFQPTGSSEERGLITLLEKWEPGWHDS